MRADGHFRAAANALRGAAQEKRREVDELRNRLQREENDTKHQADEARSRIRQTELDMVHAETGERDSGKAARLVGEMNNLQKYISDLQDAFDRQRRQWLDRIRDLEAEINDLNNQARNFETRT